jgi:hypothetical protein
VLIRWRRRIAPGKVLPADKTRKHTLIT